jgi:hypothetical protein
LNFVSPRRGNRPPMTANNVVFITLEDETDHSNFICRLRTLPRGSSIKTIFPLIKGIAEERGMIKVPPSNPSASFFRISQPASNYRLH